MTTQNGPEQQIQEFSQQWYHMMVQIWRDRLTLANAYNTGALHRSIQPQHLTQHNLQLTAAFQFLQYGIYVDAGTGRGYTHNNQGNLRILNPTYRKQHHLHQPRRPRPWFSRSWAISVKVMANKMQEILGQQYIGAFQQLNDKT